MINSIELTNWKTHEKSLFTFSKGTNILIGQMGAGKSSVMDAISFALFGTFPAVKVRRVNTNDIIRNRPRQIQGASVRLAFTIDKDKYIVERSIAREGSAKARLEKNGSYVQSQPQRVSEEIAKALKVDYDLFSRAIYSEQNNLDYFMQLRASERKKEIDTLLGLDRFTTAQENTTALINKLRDMTEDEERLVKSLDAAGLEAQLGSLEEEGRKLAQERFSMEKELNARKAYAVERGNELKRLGEAYAKRIALERELESLSARQKAIGEELERLGSKKLRSQDVLEGLIKKGEDELRMLKDNEKRARDALRLGSGMRSKMEERLEQLSKQRSERDMLEKALKGKAGIDIERLIKEHEDMLERLTKDAAYAGAGLRDVNKWLRELEGHSGTCPLCEQSISESTRLGLIEARKGAAEGLKRQESEKTAKAKSIREGLKALEEELAKVHAAEISMERYKSLEKEQGSASAELERLSGECGRLEALVENSAKALSEAQDILHGLKSEKESSERYEVHRAERTRLELLIKGKREDLLPINVSGSDFEHAHSSFTDASSAVARLSEALASGLKSISENMKQQEEKRKGVERLRVVRAEIESRKGAMENMARFRNALRDAQRELRTALIDSINNAMQEAWPDLYPYMDYTGIVLEVEENDYVLKLKTHHELGERWENVESIASGGERSIACMCMRIAFSMVLVPNLRWLILDEPTHNIDQNGIGKLVRIFGGSIQNYAEQVFIITHDEQLKDVANSRIYMLNRDKDNNGSTMVEQ